MNVLTCQRCNTPLIEPIRLFICLQQGPIASGPLPVLSGGVLEICVDCYAQWLAAFNTWLQLSKRTSKAAP